MALLRLFTVLCNVALQYIELCPKDLPSSDVVPDL